MSKKWNALPIEEKVVRLRQMTLLLTAAVFLMAIVGIIMTMMIVKLDRDVHPAQPHRTEQHVRTAWA